MPRMNGFDASKSIRTFNDKTPIIALTAAVMNEDKILSKKQECRAFSKTYRF